MGLRAMSRAAPKRMNVHESTQYLYAAPDPLLLFLLPNSQVGNVCVLGRLGVCIYMLNDIQILLRVCDIYGANGWNWNFGAPEISPYMSLRSRPTPLKRWSILSWFLYLAGQGSERLPPPLLAGPGFWFVIQGLCAQSLHSSSCPQQCGPAVDPQ